MISAHESPLAAMAFDIAGTKLATASNKVCIRSASSKLIDGLFLTLARERLFVSTVQSMVHGSLSFVAEFDGKCSFPWHRLTSLVEAFRSTKNLHQSLRWMSFRVATIYSLAFSPDSVFLAASSNTETIHIFRLANPKEK